MNITSLTYIILAIITVIAVRLALKKFKAIREEFFAQCEEDARICKVTQWGNQSEEVEIEDSVK